jgi:hypothetical protein
MQNTDMLRGSIITLLFTILFVPLVFLGDTFFPFITGKNFVFRALVEVAALLYVFLIIKDRSDVVFRIVFNIAIESYRK